MGIAEAHLVLVSLGDTSDHVLNVRADGSVNRKWDNKNAMKMLDLTLIIPDGSDVLSGTEPYVNLQSLSFVDLGDINSQVLEITLELTLRTLDSDDTGLDINGD